MRKTRHRLVAQTNPNPVAAALREDFRMKWTDKTNPPEVSVRLAGWEKKRFRDYDQWTKETGGWCVTVIIRNGKIGMMFSTDISRPAPAGKN